MLRWRISCDNAWKICSSHRYDRGHGAQELPWCNAKLKKGESIDTQYPKGPSILSCCTHIKNSPNNEYKKQLWQSEPDKGNAAAMSCHRLRQMLIYE